MRVLIRFLPTILCVFTLGCTMVESSGHSHGDHGSHSHAPHHGILNAFTNLTSVAGYIEIKLHDDKGDIELWLTDANNSAPFDIPLGSHITVTFLEMDNKQVVLKARNTVRNEDEDDKANIRKGKTNYFVFPGDSGENAHFLIGHDFASTVTVSFDAKDKLFTTDAFVLMPHTH